MPQASPSTGRTILAVCLSPLIAPPLFALMQAALTGRPPPGVMEFIAGTLFFGLYVLPLAYAGMLVFGLPSALLLARLGWLNLPMLIALAAAEGAIVIMAFFMILPGFRFSTVDWATLGGFMAMGAICAVCMAAVAWFISGRHNRPPAA